MPSTASRTSAARSTGSSSADSPGLDARQPQQALRQRLEPARLAERPQHQAALVVGGRGLLGEFEVGLEGGQRRADLVRGVGDEPAQRDDGGLVALGHGVEGVGEATELVTARDRRARREVALGHAVARLGERGERAGDARDSR